MLVGQPIFPQTHPTIIVEETLCLAQTCLAVLTRLIPVLSVVLV
jgi:hypothetical protein